MRYVSCLRGGRPIAALVDGDRLLPLRGVSELGPNTPIELLSDPPVDRAGAFALGEASLRPVIPNPRKIVCVGLNYRSHLEETGRSGSDYPVLFAKFATSLVGPYEPIVLPPESTSIDYEAEIAVVIGRMARRAEKSSALDHVAGYTIANDVSMRDYQNKTHQWLPGKSWDQSTPIGPALVTPDEAPPPEDMRLKLEYNGQTLQDATADLMIFPVDELISTISTFTTLLPGDVILTGTPGGVGMRRTPPVWLRPGGRVRVSVTGLGQLDNPLIADDVESSTP